MSLVTETPEGEEIDTSPITFREHWAEFSPRTKAVVGTVATIVFLAVIYNLPGGIGKWFDDKAPLGIVASGAIIGTVTALLAMGLILVYRTSRFINFAYGAMGSFAGTFAIGLHLEKGLNFFYVALPVGIALGMLTGLVVDRVMRRFQSSSRLIVTVASIGIAQILAFLELIAAQKILGFVSLTGGFVIPLSFTIPLPAKSLYGDEILIMMAVPPILLGLAWFLLKTDAGVGVRAAAENADRALLLGIPIKRLTTIVWVIAGALAALVYVLKAPFSGVTPGIAAGSATVLLPALAAAVVARMESLPVAFAAGIALGVVEQVVRWNSTGTPTLQNMVFLVVILAALLLQRGKLSRAMDSGTSTWSATGVLKPIPEELRRVPEVLWSKRALLTVLGIASVVWPMFWAPSSQSLAALALIWGMAAVSLVILTGWGGHISLGQFAIVGAGAVTAANLLTKWNTDFILTLIASATAGALIACLVGLPALRIKGLFLAVTTLAFAVALDTYIINPENFPWLIPSERVERPLLLERFDLNDNYTLYVFCLILLGFSVLIAQGLRKARAGRVIIATRDNERAADAAAVPTTSVKLAAFVVSGAIAGAAGAVHMLIIRQLATGSYASSDSVELFSTAVIGGLGSVAGALSGVLLFQWLGTITALGEIRLALTGGVLLIVLLFLPGGIGQLLYNLRDRWLRNVANRRGIHVPSLVADKREDGGDQPRDETNLLATALTDDAPDTALEDGATP